MGKATKKNKDGATDTKKYRRQNIYFNSSNDDLYEHFQKQNDKIKEEYANLHNYSLKIIWYYEFKNINKILKFVILNFTIKYSKIILAMK